MTTDRQTPNDSGLDTPPGRAVPGTSLRGMALGTVAAALVAGLVAWVVGESSFVQVPARIVRIVTIGQESMATTAAGELAAILARSTRSQAVFGAALGLALGAAGGLASRSPRRALSGSVVGLAVGAIAGLIVTSAGIPSYYRLRESLQDDLLPSLLLHGTTGVAVGVAAALALGIGVGWGRASLLRSVLGAALGAILGAVAFVLIGAVLFPLDGTGEPIARTAVPRLLARLLVAVSVAIGISTALGARRNGDPKA